MSRILCAVLALLLPAVGLNAVQAAGYKFTNIVDATTAAPNGTFSNFNSPSISGDRVAFLGSYPGGHGIFTSADGQLTTIAKRGDAAPSNTFFSLSDPAISGSTVVFRGSFGDPGDGIFTGSGGPLTTIVRNGDPAPAGTFAGFGAPAISGSVVAFRALQGGQLGAFTYDGGLLTTITNPGGPGPIGNPAISGGTVAFRGIVDSGDPSLVYDGIFAGDGGPIATLIRTGDPAPIGLMNYGIHNEVAISGNRVAFVGSYSDGSNSGSGVLSTDGAGIPTSIAQITAAPFGIFMNIWDVAISGTDVAFLASYEEFDGDGYGIRGGEGIFVGSGASLDTVVKTGDPLFGSVVGNIDAPTIGFDPSGSGNIAFVYWLADGRRGVAMASIVPEPSTGLLFALGGFVLCCFRSNHGKLTLRNKLVAWSKQGIEKENGAGSLLLLSFGGSG